MSDTPKDPVTGYIDYVRLIVNAIIEGRAEASTVKAMTDDEIEAFIAEQSAATHAEVERGRHLNPS